MKKASLVIALEIILATGVSLLYVSDTSSSWTPVSGDQFGTWNVTGSPYIVEGSVRVPEGRTLTIEPGVEVRFEPGTSYGIRVEGTLIARGASDSPILFTSNDTIPYAGDWKGIDVVSTGLLEVEYCIIEYARVALYLRDVRDSIISNSSVSRNHVGIYLSNSTNISILNNTLSQNLDLGLEVKGAEKEHFNHTIDTSNIVNEKAIFYFPYLSNVAVQGIVGGHILVAWSENVSIHDNSVLSGDRIGLEHVSNSTVSSNLVTESVIGITVSESENVLVEHNSLSHNRGGVHVYLSRDVIVQRNNIAGGSVGISGRHSERIFVERNTVDGSVHGVSYSDTTDSAFTSNLISNSSEVGFFFGGTNNITLEKNILSNTSGDGHYIGGSTNLTIKDSLVEGNESGFGWRGIYAAWVSTVSVENVSIMNFMYGVSLDPSFDPTNDTVEITNSSIANSKDYDIHILSTGAVLLNTSFDKTKVYYGPNVTHAPYVEVRWFLHVKVVNESGKEIVGADVEIRDIDNLLVSRRETDSRGYARWMVTTEYTQHDENGDHDGGDLGETRFSTPHNVSARKYGLTGYAIPDPNMDTSRLVLVILNTSSLPRPPQLQDARLTGPNLKDVLISWNLSKDDGSGLDNVDHYALYSSSRYETYGRDYEFMAEVPPGADQYLHENAGEGDPDSHFYYVQANTTLAGGLWEGQVGKFTRSLAPGPRLVSIPLIQSNESIEYVLQTVEYDKVWFYDSSSQEWKWHMTFKDYRRGLWNVNRSMGLWVNVTDDSNLTVAGVVPAQTTIQLYKGWNLVSFPSFNASYSVSDLKAEIGATSVEGYDVAPPNFLRVLGDAEVLQAGYGYWVRVEMDTVWTTTIE